ncbi:Hypothetical predicted protein [Pelobates cultripes]|uniref:Uncharacterized protein n=1 Tax=Pelobates cultripes TaxID=61616 RepID=A0AAD1THF8_PELCU|nr:Hypothetical predicted protein [Pelobates cultripes]
MKQMFDADMNLARTEIKAVSQRVQASEEEITDIRQELKTMADTLCQLQSSDSVFQLRLDTMEDHNRLAKKLEFDEHFRINKPKQALPAAAQDIIVRFHSILDKLRFLNAVRNQIPLDFESYRLTFFQDITRTTLHWRKSLSPITAQLQNAKVDYRWLLPRT